jgi:hypothetical protein
MLKQTQCWTPIFILRFRSKFHRTVVPPWHVKSLVSVLKCNQHSSFIFFHFFQLWFAGSKWLWKNNSFVLFGKNKFVICSKIFISRRAPNLKVLTFVEHLKVCNLNSTKIFILAQLPDQTKLFK